MTSVALALKSAMRGAAATVSVVSTRIGEDRYAMTATSFCSVSMDPPSILVCVNQSAAMHGALTTGAGFCLNLLTAQQRHLSVACGGAASPAERFAGGDWDDHAGTPYLPEARCNLFCRVERLIAHGTHTIVIGEVIDVNSQGASAPLVYLNGDYLDPQRLPAE